MAKQLHCLALIMIVPDVLHASFRERETAYLPAPFTLKVCAVLESCHREWLGKAPIRNSSTIAVVYIVFGNQRIVIETVFFLLGLSLRLLSEQQLNRA